MHRELDSWVREVANLTKPDRVVWCDGSEEEHQALVEQQIADGTLHQLNEKTYPNCHLHRSDPRDVARVEHLTFICTEKQEDAGPTNNWMSPDDADGSKCSSTKLEPLLVKIASADCRSTGSTATPSKEAPSVSNV